MTNKEFELEKQILKDVELHLIRRRFNFVQDALKNQREDIETLFRYMKFWGIHAILLNLVIIGLMICLILTS